MSDFLGKDIGLDDDMDLTFTPDGDFELIEGASCVAQDVKSAIFESDIYQFLNDEASSKDEVVAFLEDVLYNEPRINYESIKIQVDEIKNGIEKDYQVSISFDVITENNTQNLVFNLSDIITLEKLNG